MLHGFGTGCPVTPVNKATSKRQASQSNSEFRPRSLDELAEVIHSRQYLAMLASKQFVRVNKQANISQLKP